MPAPHPSQADINIGVVLSLTAQGASLGIPARNTIAMGPKEIAGQKVNVTVLDDASDATAADVAARRLTQEMKADVLIGPSITPTSLTVVQVAGEAQTPVITLAGSDAIVAPQEGNRRWAIKMPPGEAIPLKMIFDHMVAHKQRRPGIAAVSNAYGQTFVDVAQKRAAEAGIEIVTVERFAATDTSFVAQGVKRVATSPDAVLVAAAATAAALPQLELEQRLSQLPSGDTRDAGLGPHYFFAQPRNVGHGDAQIDSPPRAFSGNTVSGRGLSPIRITMPRGRSTGRRRPATPRSSTDRTGAS